MEWVKGQKTRQKAFLVCLIGMDSVLDTVHGQVFDGVKSCLERLRIVADLVLLTSVNVRSTYSEWNFYHLPACTAVCLKRREAFQCLATLIEEREYDRSKILVVGFGPQALEAVEKNRVLYYPIFPGQENLNWHMLEEEAMPKLLHGTYSGDYQDVLLARHSALFEKNEDTGS